MVRGGSCPPAHTSDMSVKLSLNLAINYVYQLLGAISSNVDRFSLPDQTQKLEKKSWKGLLDKITKLLGRGDRLDRSTTIWSRRGSLRPPRQMEDFV